MYVVSLSLQGLTMTRFWRMQMTAYRIRILPTRNGRALWSALKTCVSRFKRNGLILSREHKRDEKKIIIPTLKKNAKKLYAYWNQYINGYIPPEEDETGKQYYKES